MTGINAVPNWSDGTRPDRICCDEESAAVIGKPQRRNIRVVVEWAANAPSLQEIAAIRKLVPRLQDTGIAVVKETLQHSSCFEVGVFYPFQANELRIKAAAIGLRIRLEAIS